MTMTHFRPAQHTMYVLSSIRRYRRRNAESLSRSIPVPMLCMIISGKGMMNLNGTAYPIEPFQLWHLPAGSSIEASVQGQDIEYYLLLIETISTVKHKGKWILAPDSSNGFITVSPFPQTVTGTLPLQDPQDVRSRIEELHNAWLGSKQGLSAPASPNVDLQLQSLMATIWRDSAQLEQTLTSEHGIERCIAYLHEHYSRKITRNTLAELAKLTPNAFCRSFKRETGLAPTDYLNRIRISHAKSILSADVSVKEVALAVGYGSEYYFSRVFKDTVGMSPSLFIKREKLKIATASRCGFEDNLSSIGIQAVVAVDCYKYPWMDTAEYDRRRLSQLEQLRLRKPDLIVADYAHRDCYDTLKQIAPTVLIEHQLDWRSTHAQIAALVGREQEAEQSLALLDKTVFEIRKKLHKYAQSHRVTVLQILAQRIRVQGTVNHPLNQLIYDELGLCPGTGVPLNKMRDELLPEELPSLESDHLFIIKPSDQPQAEQLWTHLRHSPSGKSLNAVPHRSIHFIPNWLVMSWTPQGRMRIMDELMKHVGNRIQPTAEAGI